METRSLYIHIPFCNDICSYCDFCKVYYDKKQVNLYLERLYQEFKTLDTKSFDTIYIGGGTPSSLDDEQLEYLLDIIKPYTKEVKEYCMEMNPESMDYYKLQILKQAGVNRLSIGVQTFNEDILKTIERKHNNYQVTNLIKYAHDLGFNNISIDLMYGLPGQTMADIKKDIDILETLNIQHVSYYSLILEEHTILNNKQYQTIDDQDEYQINVYIDQRLSQLGFNKYEVSNYAKENYQSLHNKCYWLYNNYYGIGVGSAGKIDSQMIEHSRSFTDYNNGKDIKHIQELSKEDTMFNHLMMSLRLVTGLSLEEFKNRYHLEVKDVYPKALQDNLDNGRLIIEDNHLKTTKESIYYLNDILIDFVD